MGIELSPGQPCYEARVAGCTCAWLRGFGVTGDPVEWGEKIIDYDPDCPDPSHLGGSSRDGDLGKVTSGGAHQVAKSRRRRKGDVVEPQDSHL